MNGLKAKLNKIYEVISSYIDDKADSVGLEGLHIIKSDAKLRSAIILQAVADLYGSSVEEQLDAVRYFQSNEFYEDAELSQIPSSILNKIIYSPETYAAAIDYDYEERYHDLSI